MINCGGERMAVRIATLGCKVNQADSEELAQALIAQGCRVAVPGEPAAVCVINTCTVTHVADAKARKLIRRLARDNPGAPIIVTGCGGQSVGQMTGVTRVVPNPNKDDLPRLVQDLVAQVSNLRAQDDILWHHVGARPTRPGSLRAYVKVQDGCDGCCAYCIVPAVRGPMRSRPAADVVTQIRALAEAGAREVVICGIRLGAYGDVAQPPPAVKGGGLARLLRAIRDAPVARLRLSSIEPWDLGDELIAAIAEHPLLCRHLHLPLQSGDDDALRAMRRPHSFADYRELVERLRQRLPDIAITTDLMVGFPGESESAFESTCRAVAEIGFARAHIFRYSRRPGTAAASLPQQVPEGVKAARAARLAEVVRESARRFSARFVGRMVRVLFEKCEGGVCSGLTEAYVRARAPGDPTLVGQVAGVTVESVEDEVLSGCVAGCIAAQQAA